MGEIFARNDLPAEGSKSHDVDFRTKIAWADDPHTEVLKPGDLGTMRDDHIESGKDYTVEAQIKLAAHRDVHVAIDTVKAGQTVIVTYDGDQYLLKKEG